jgi:hypothetical protein
MAVTIITKLHHTNYETIINEYWLELKTYLFGSQVESDLLNNVYYTGPLNQPNMFLNQFSLHRVSGIQGSRRDHLEYIRANFEKYRNVFETIPHTEILLRFVYLASLVSLDSEPPIAINELGLKQLTGLTDLSKILVLARKDGIFTPDEYLDALFNNYFLVGVPIKITSFDNRTGVPLVFIDHDCDHIKEMLKIGTSEMFLKHKIIYQRMLEDHTLQNSLKQLFIDIFFVLLHEENIFLFTANPISDDTELLSDFDDAFINSLCSGTHRRFKVAPIIVDDIKINQIFQKYNFTDTTTDLNENEKCMMFGKILLKEYIMS